MAYVMNPYSYKLGYSLSWSDDWFSNKKLYPVMLQNMLTIRYFLIFFWTSRNIEKLDTYLSHLNLTLNSGRLLITLFFYEAKLNQPGKYKYKMLQSVIHSIPFSSSNPEFTVKWRIKNSSIPVRAPKTTSAAKGYFFYENTALETIESQRFFLFFHFLGLDPGSFLLELYTRYGKRAYGDGEEKKELRYLVANKRFRNSGQKNATKTTIFQLEFVFLNRIYKFLNEKVFFFWLYDKEKNLNMVRFLRTLFFYGGMAYFGKKYTPLMRSPGLSFSNFSKLNNIKKSKKITKRINYVKEVFAQHHNYVKKKKFYNYNFFLKKVQIMNYFDLLNLDYKKVLLSYKKNYPNYNLYTFLYYIVKSIKMRKLKKKSITNMLLVKKKPKYRFNRKRWYVNLRKRNRKIKHVFAYRNAKIKLIEKYYSISASYSYRAKQMSSTKFDSWGKFFSYKDLKSYEYLIDHYGFSRTFWGKKLEINTLTRFYYYRIFYNVYGNFFWNLSGKELSYYFNFSRRTSRYLFFNKKYRKLYKNFLLKSLKKFNEFEQLDKYANSIYSYYNYLDNYISLKKKYNKAVAKYLILKRKKYWKFFENFWDFKKIHPKIINSAIDPKRIYHKGAYMVPVDDGTYPPEKLDLLEKIINWEATSWVIYDTYREVYGEMMKMGYIVQRYELLLNKYFKYKKYLYKFKLDLIKKNKMFNKKKKKSILLWKTKYWSKFKKNNNFVVQKKGDYIIHNRYYNSFNKKKVKTFLFLHNEGIFNLIEQNSVLIKNWFKSPPTIDKLYINKVGVNKNFIYYKKHELSNINKNYLYVKNVKKDLKKTVKFIKFIKFIKNNKLVKNNKINFYKFLKNNNYENNEFIKKNYKDLLKVKISKKNKFLLFKKKLLLLEKKIKFLKNLSKKKRLNYLLNFFEGWYLKVKPKKKKSMIDSKFWLFFVYRARPKTFKWKQFKPFLRKKENINWGKFYKFFKDRVLNASFDFRSLRKKIRNQEYSRKKTNYLISKFEALRDIRKKRMLKAKAYPRYGFKLYKYFNNFNRTVTFLQQKIRRRFFQQYKNLNMVRFSYARLFFIFWFISLRTQRNSEPKEMFLNKHYGRENLYDFGSLLFIYILKTILWLFWLLYTFYFKILIRYFFRF